MQLKIPKSAYALNSPCPIPSQAELDAVAAFIEAAEELEREPFFGPDEKRTCSTCGEAGLTFTLGDRFHFRSALISFRRIWMKGEASNFDRVYGILWRTAPSVNVRVPLLWARGFIRETQERDAHLHFGLTIPGLELIDLWLNTVFAHGGMDLTKKNTRVRFDEIVSTYGHAPFEYAFRVAVWAIGIQYVSAAKNVARPALERWAKDTGLRPSFTIGAAFGTKTRERTKEGHIIVRRASSEYAADETFDQRLKRLLDRPSFRAV